MKTKLLFAFLITLSLHINAQSVWKPIKFANKLSSKIEDRGFMPNKFQLYSLDFKNFKNDLKLKTSNDFIELPISKGKIQKFRILETSNLAPELATKFPMIKSYTAQAINDITTTAKISVGTNGLYVMIFSGKKVLYIDPYTKDKTKYIAYKRNSLPKNISNFRCLTKNSSEKKMIANRPLSATDDKLRTYRLALACTGEYAQFHLKQQNIPKSATEIEKKAAVLSAMNTTMTRVNGIYERDLSVKMVIVANDEQLIFLNSEKDEYRNNEIGQLYNKNQIICDRIIGKNNYDIGHVFSTGGGGLAYIEGVCNNKFKAKGVTGTRIPLGDFFDIDFVAHEMGHQFGAEHTFNNDCDGNISEISSVEPGSGSTIMSYSGICPPNAQNHSDPYFHYISIQQMWNTIIRTVTCASLTTTNNTPPTANAGLDYFIPKSTPFILKGQGNDVDSGNKITYCWEQIDAEIATMPPLETNTSGPLFRSMPPTYSSNRYMPALSTVVSGKTFSKWEVIPSVARKMNFSLVVRDNNLGGGSTAIDNMKITVNGNSGPFVVTSQNKNTATKPIKWIGNTLATITWDVANTYSSPINCKNVTILFSEDNGVTFNKILLKNTPNDGSEDVLVPNINTIKGRIMIQAADNLFYAVNKSEISVTKLQLTNNLSVFPNPSKNHKIIIGFKMGENKNVTIKLYTIQGKLIATNNYNNVNNVNNDFITVITYNQLINGLYFLQVTNGDKKIVKKVIIN